MYTKTIWTSKTFWGAVLSLIVYLVHNYYGYVIDEDNIQILAKTFADIGIAVGTILTVYGRIVAHKDIDVKGSISVFNIIGHLVKIWNAIKR